MYSYEAPRQTRPSFPYPMQYLGSKGRIADWILEESVQHFGKPELFIDTMAGSGAVSHAAHMLEINLGINDLQPYSHALLEAAFVVPRDTLPDLRTRIEKGEVERRLFEGGRVGYERLLREEDKYLNDGLLTSDKINEINNFLTRERGSDTQSNGEFDLFVSYYRNTYLGVRQCLEIDTLRQIAEESRASDAKHILAALISAISQVASTTTHLAQYLKPGTESQTSNIVSKRRRSIVEHVVWCLDKAIGYPVNRYARVLNTSFQNAILDIACGSLKPLVYADPPYFKEHYSRYYHLLDTLVLYDYPDLTWNGRLGKVTVGMYRKNRLVSDFGLKTKVRGAFSELVATTLGVGGGLALSYADTSLMKVEEIYNIAREHQQPVQVREIKLKHSGQGARNQSVTEYLFLIGHKE